MYNVSPLDGQGSNHVGVVGMKSRACFLVLGIWIGACTSGTDGLEVTTVPGALNFDEVPGSVSYNVGAEITVLDKDNGIIVVGTPDGLLGLFGLELVELAVYPDPGEPLTTGAIKAITVRDNGILVAAEQGLFHTFESALLYSPLSAAVDGLDIVAMSSTGSGESEEIWLATDDGLARVHDGLLEMIDFPGESLSPTAVAATADRVLVAFETNLYELEIEELTYQILAGDFGSITGIQAAGQEFIVACERGLLVRQADGTYHHYTLRDEGAGAAVDAVSYDSNSQGVGLYEDGLLSLASGSPEGLVTLDPPTAGRTLAVDDYGNAWVGTSTELVGWMVGDVVGFESEVSPILDQNCGYCHTAGVSGAPKQDFTNYGVAVAMADSIVNRVSTGLMPPGAPLFTSSPDDYETLIRWYTTGMNP